MTKEPKKPANTTALYVRLDTDLKDQAEFILERLGITPSSAVQMLYSQIILQGGLPFEPRLPQSDLAAMGGMSAEELDRELLKGVRSYRSGKYYSTDEVDAMLKKEFGI